MFMHEMEMIDRAMAVDKPFAKYIRSRHGDSRDPHALDVASKNPLAYRYGMGVMRDKQQEKRNAAR